VLQEHHLRGYEIGLVANLNPQTVDEAQALVPSLKVGHWRGQAAVVQWVCPSQCKWQASVYCCMQG
jgi:hypothetical protein